MKQINFDNYLHSLFKKHVKEIGEKNFGSLSKPIQSLCFDFFILGHGEGMNTFKKINFRFEQDLNEIKTFLNSSKNSGE